MGDNGHFTKYSPGSGIPMILRGDKAAVTEGGVRVDAFARWPGMIKADSIVAKFYDLFGYGSWGGEQCSNCKSTG